MRKIVPKSNQGNKRNKYGTWKTFLDVFLEKNQQTNLRLGEFMVIYYGTKDYKKTP